MSDQQPSYVVAALDKGLFLLRFLAENPDTGVSEIAAKTGSTKSQIFRLLYTLEQRGFVHKDSVTRNYVLGHMCLFLGERVRSRSSFVEVAEPIMARLVTETQENVNLVVRQHLHSVVVALKESHQPVRLYAEVGREGPLHAGGSSMVLLAHAPAHVIDEALASPLDTFTPRTEVRPDVIRTVLCEIRENGHHVALDDLDPGAFSIAAPVRNHAGEVIAALSIAGPVSRLSPATVRSHVERVKRAAHEISEGLGSPGLAHATT